MAATHDLVLTLRLRWWVRPYTGLLTMFLWSIAFAVDADDERVETFIEAQTRFIVERGINVSVKGSRRWR